MFSFLFATVLAAASPSPGATPVATATPAPTPDPKPAKARPSDPYAGRIAAFGVSAGIAVPGGELGMSPGFAISARRPVAMDGRLVVGAELGFVRSSASGNASEPGLPAGQGYKVAVTAIPLALHGLWHQPAGPVWIAAGAGPVFAPITVTSSAGGGTNRERSTAVGGEILGGAELPLGPGVLAADLSFRFLTASGVKATGSGNLGGPGLRVGFRIAF